MYADCLRSKIRKVKNSLFKYDSNDFGWKDKIEEYNPWKMVPIFTQVDKFKLKRIFYAMKRKYIWK